MSVWYEDHGSLYLWIGAFEKKGLARQALREIDATTNYPRWSVKTSCANERALRLLAAFGFAEYAREGGVVFLERKKQYV